MEAAQGCRGLCTPKVPIVHLAASHIAPVEFHVEQPANVQPGNQSCGSTKSWQSDRNVRWIGTALRSAALDSVACQLPGLRTAARPKRRPHPDKCRVRLNGPSRACH